MNFSQTPRADAVPKPASPVLTGAITPAALKPIVAPKPRPSSQKLGFKLSEFIVYPAHGVGQIVGIEVQEVAGFSLELFVVSFIKDKMILKVPTSKVAAVGMRKLSEGDTVERALATLSGRARIKRTMWSRRAQEYEAKINSGDLVTIAEVVRDLYRSDTQPEQSYSERQLYEAALDRMSREVSAVRKLLDSELLKVIESYLAKGPRRGVKNEPDAAGEEADVERAAERRRCQRPAGPHLPHRTSAEKSTKPPPFGRRLFLLRFRSLDESGQSSPHRPFFSSVAAPAFTPT